MSTNPATRTMVVISRHWHQPQVVVGIDHEHIRLELSLEDFCVALAAEVPHPSLTMTRAGLEGQLVEAMHRVLFKTKESSVYNPPAVPPAAE